ncbi:uncharacterized protein SAPINGB_P001549 [Magnusiomyces paraingens]|uniref:HIT domain-containing protein n=1 Tax=Magnusiomyces paraingens TaxID=2606893 RepID=A0A5E8B6Y6_9ASCO|nr:uncharacterized protein SAPINGB_P001549 [Saprochaete ingens]VVT47113.1 unnamed protein product [Saprochaete ingens]
MDLVKNFQFSRILSNSTDSKKIYLLGTIDSQNAIVAIEKVAFDLDPKSLSDYKSLGIDQLRLLDINDVYSWNMATLIQNIDSNPAAKVNVIYPASDTHIKKYQESKPRYIVETPELYQKYVAPYVESMRGDRIKWVHQILFKGTEAERVLTRVDEDPSGRNGTFVLLPDLKWDRKTLETLYLIAISIKDIASIRDLTEAHIPMLESIRDKIYATVYEKYGLEPSQLKIYVHYQPSYYHFHIHVTHVQLQQNDFGRSIFLDSVIEQLRHLGPEGFSKATLTYLLSDTHDLWTNGFSKELR